MELTKHKNHRNLNYLAWLRLQPCAVSGDEAECAHHIRIGTNGGTGLKPSDYFCIPLLNEYHTTGSDALHMIGEETFIERYELDTYSLFIYYLQSFLKEVHDEKFKITSKNKENTIKELVTKIEALTNRSSAKIKKPKKSITEDPYYQKSKEAKRVYDKEMRDKIKETKVKVKAPSLKGNEFYEKAKEQKKIYEKEMRQKLKATSSGSNDEYKKAQKERAAKYRKEQYQKQKEYKKNSSKR